MNTLYPYLNDTSFLREFDRFPDKEQFVNVTVLSWDEQPIQTIHGKITGGGSINLDGKSAIRRTCNLSLLAEAKENDLANMDNIFAINKKVRIEIGFTNKMGKYTEYDKIWFPLGTFVNISPSISYNAQGVTISMQLKDKMCLLNGEVGGVFPAQVTHDFVEIQDENGNWITEKIKIYQIIRELVNHWGGEQLGKIIINDVPDQIKQVMKWVGDEPIYLVEPKDGSKPFYSYTVQSDKKFEKGQDIGYQWEDFTYPGELTSEAGSSIVDALDKIKNTLGNFEYFYDLDGNFVFQEIKNYLNTKQVTGDLNGLVNKDYKVDFFRSKAAYSLEDEMLVTSYSNTPQFNNLKNDFIVWGNMEGGGDSKIPIRYRLAIDEKPSCEGLVFENLVIYTEPPLTVEAANVIQTTYNGVFKEEISYKTKEYVEEEIEIIKDVLDEEGNPVLDENEEPIKVIFKEKKRSDEPQDVEHNVHYTFIGAKAPLIYEDEGFFPERGQEGIFYYSIGQTSIFMWVQDPKTLEWSYKEQPQYWLSKIIPTDWRTVLYLQGVVAENSSLNSNEYYAELANEWPRLYNIAGGKKGDVYLGNWRTDIDLTNIQYFLDFIEGSEELSSISVKNIGRRSKVVNDDKINCLFERDVPNYVLVEEVEINDVEKYNLVSELSLCEKEIEKLVQERDLEIKKIKSEISAIEKERDSLISNNEDIKEWQEYIKAEKEKEASLSKELEVVIETLKKIDEDENIESEKDKEDEKAPFEEEKKQLETNIQKVASNITFYTTLIDTTKKTITNYYEPSIKEKQTLITEITESAQPAIDKLEEDKKQIPEDKYQKIKSDISNLAFGGNSNPAFLRIQDLLWEHTSYNQSVTINALPVYHLEPNTRIALHNGETGIYGDYIINSMTLPLDISGTMSLNCTKALDKI